MQEHDCSSRFVSGDFAFLYDVLVKIECVFRDSVTGHPYYSISDPLGVSFPPLGWMYVGESQLQGLFDPYRV